MQRQTLAFSLSCFFLGCLFANHAWAIDTDYGGGWYFNLGAGRTQPFLEHTSNYVGTGPGWPNDQYKPNNMHGAPMLVLGTGFTWTRYNDWFPGLSLGAQFTYTGQAKISGVIYQYSLPEFENYTYEYQFRRATLLAVGKAHIVNLACFLPYVTAGLGVSFNTTNNYNEQPLSNVTPRISPGYQSATNHYFSYMAGVGVDYAIHNYLLVGLEYNYGSYGYAQTGNGDHTPSLAGYDYSSQSLKNKFRANNLFLTITYLLNQE